MPLVEKDKDLGIFEKSPNKSTNKSPNAPRVKSDEMNERMDKAIELIAVNPYITRKQIAEQLCITEDQAKTVISKLKESGRIHREGSKIKGEWIVN